MTLSLLIYSAERIRSGFDLNSDGARLFDTFEAFST
jgi:hypothetical protein